MEIYTLIAVGSEIGAMATLGIIIVTGLLGAVLARQQGFRALREVQTALTTGGSVGRVLVEAALVLVASVLLLTPGLFTDAFGLSLLLPPIRRVAAQMLINRFAGRVTQVAVGSTFPWPGGPGDIRGHGPADHPVDGSPDDTDHDPPPPGVIDV